MVDEEEAPEEVAEAEPEAVFEAVWEAVLAPAAEVWAIASAVAFRVPHFSLFVQVCCASALLGLALMHWAYVAWHSK